MSTEKEHFPNVDTERLARSLHDAMERLDPTDDPDWDSMSDLQRDLYRFTIRALLEDDSFQAAFSRRPTTT
jgi:hypothetical protein